jgi:hypothetical protein
MVHKLEEECSAVFQLLEEAQVQVEMEQDVWYDVQMDNTIASFATCTSRVGR